jgi:hypothetical protein
LYSPETKNAVNGGAPAIEAIMRSAQLYADHAFHNSGISARVEVITKEHSVLRRTDVATLLSDVVGAIDEKTFAQTKKPSAEIWSAISAIRDEQQASIVALLTDIDNGNHGQASVIPQPPRLDASSLTHATLAIAITSRTATTALLAHELGHLLGGMHDRFTQPKLPDHFDPKYDYVRGYVPTDGSFTTIMGYDHNDRPYVPAYSAADRTLNGKALGIPFGQPNAADAARFFRLSTRIVANYRGPNTPRWSPVDLQLAVDPPVGGTVTPSALPPYPEGTIVSVSAMPRDNGSGLYKFSHWTLDGANTGTTPTTLVRMDRPHSLIAHFVAGAGQFTFKVDQPPVDANLSIKLTPPGPVYAPGTNVTATLIGPAAKEMISQWLIDGQPAGNSDLIRLHATGNHDISIRIRSARTFLTFLHQESNFLIDINTTRSFSVRVFDQANTQSPNQWIVFSHTGPAGCKLESPVRVQSDAQGHASIVLHTGVVDGNIQITAKLENSDALEAVLNFTIPKIWIDTVSPADRGIFPETPPIALGVIVRELGRPMKGIPIKFSIPDVPFVEGELTLFETETDEHGVAQTAFKHNVNGTGPVGGDSFALHAEVRLPGGTQIIKFPTYYLVTKRMLAFIGEADRTIRIGKISPKMSIIVQDFLEKGGMVTGEGVKIYLSLSNGGTGISLEANTAITDSRGETLVNLQPATCNLQPATGTGVATLIAATEHAKNATFTIHVI